MSDKCLSCEHINCVNLEWQPSDDPLFGGAFQVARTTIKEGEVLPCVLGGPIKSYCSLAEGIQENLGGKTFLTEMAWSLINDLETSAFLAMSAHYRGACQALRPLLENFLTALYFETMLQKSGSKEDVNEIEDRWHEWIKGDYEIPEKEWKAVGMQTRYVERDGEYHALSRKRRLNVEFLKRWLDEELPNEVFSGTDSQIIQELTSEFNKFLHPYPKNMSKFPVLGDGKLCGAVRSFDQESLQEFSKLYQDLVTFLLEKTLALYQPAISEEDYEYLGYVAIFDTLDVDLEEIAISNNFREFIRGLDCRPEKDR